MNHVEILDQLIREMDGISSRPVIRIRRPRAPQPARSTMSAFVDQFVNLLVIR